MSKRQKQLLNTYLRQRNTAVNEQYVSEFELHELAYSAYNKIKNNYHDIDGMEWIGLLAYHPEYIDNFLRFWNVEDIDAIDDKYKAQILTRQPQLYDVLKPDLSNLKHNEWKAIDTLFNLLLKQPQFIDKVSLDEVNKLQSRQRATLVAQHMELYDKIKTDDFIEYNFADMLKNNPNTITKFTDEQLKRIHGYLLGTVLLEQPQLHKYFDISDLYYKTVAEITDKYPEYTDTYLHAIDKDYHITHVLGEKPELYDSLSAEQKEKMKGNETILFKENPEFFGGRFKFFGFQIDMLLGENPKLSKYIDFTKLSKYELSSLVKKYPFLLKDKSFNKALTPEVIEYMVNYHATHLIPKMSKNLILKMFKIGGYLMITNDAVRELEKRFPNIEELVYERNRLWREKKIRDGEKT